MDVRISFSSSVFLCVVLSCRNFTWIRISPDPLIGGRSKNDGW